MWSIDFAMYLKRLEIQGFKSFANKTSLDFLPPKDGRFSITAVVGPNGSGKSNVTDAIRWVMGETSMKSLRGKKSEDVIFSGSETKGQLGAAEVTMVLDNADNTVGLDYPEIVITRRLYRSGETEYLINNNTVRLLDVHLLLAKAQFAQHGYTLVGQGTIDKLLTVSIQERKDFLDEASGIKEYQIRHHQAVLKLARTEENMNQAQTLMTEVEPRLKLLARQVKKLEKRQELEVALREAQEKYYATLAESNNTDCKNVDDKLKIVDGRYQETFKLLQETQSELATLARSSSRDELFDELQSKHQEAVRAKNELERQLAILQGQMQSEYREAGKQNLNWLNNKIEELKLKTDEMDATYREAEKVKLLSEEELTTEKKKIQQLGEERARLILQISELQNRRMTGESEKNYWQWSGLTAVKAVKEARENFGKLFGLVAELAEVDEEHRLALEVAAGSHMTSLVVEDESTASRAIEYLRREKLGVATFLPLTKIGERYGGREIDSYVSAPGVRGRAIELLRFNEKFRNIFSFVLGDTLVVDDLAAAEKVGVGQVRMVTLQGDLIERSGVMKGGYRSSQRRSISFSGELSLNSGERLHELEEKIKVLQGNLSDLEKENERITAGVLGKEVAYKTAEARAELLLQDRHNIEKELAGLSRELEISSLAPADRSVALAKLQEDKNKLDNDLKAAEEKVGSLSSEIGDFNRREEEKKQRVFALQEKMQKEQAEVNNILAERQDLKIEMARLETKKEDLEREVEREMNAVLASIIERNPPTIKMELLPEVADDIQKLKYQLSLIGGIDEEVTKEYTETKEKYEFLSSQLTDLGQAIGDLGKMIEELDSLMKKKRETAFKKIRKEFDRYFKVLFGGGKAELEEVYGDVVEEGEEENMVEEVENLKPKRREKILTGIDVIVNPPGKKIKHINSLSGGERTLTSIALICAILHCNPSPFVVLDEVEAALDESNTMKFAAIMSELATQSQFIIITHNRVTMHSANALYGVVMGGDGISKLLSVKMEDVPEYEEK